MKQLLLTGSSGFIGNYFIHKYQDKYNINTFSFLNDDFNSLDEPINKINLETLCFIFETINQTKDIKLDYNQTEKIYTFYKQLVKNNSINKFKI